MSIEAIQDRIVRYPEAVKITGLSKTTMWRLVKRGAFPAPRQLSPGCVGFSLAELLQFNESRLKTTYGSTVG